MVGGEGAKERRRLKRLESHTKDKDNTVGKLLKSRNSFKKSFPDVSDPKQRLAKNPGKKAHINKQVKKPKHLKRKLEQLSPDDEQTRQVVLNEIADFQATKAQLAKNIDTKRQKKSSDSKHDMALKTHKSAANSQIAIGGSKESSVDNTHLAGIDKIVQDKPIAVAEETQHTAGHSDAEDSGDEEGEDTAQKAEEASRRERGRRRRGRKDTAKEIQEKQAAVEQEQEVPEKTERDEAISGETSDGKRYCIGRKPVTDFVVGQKYQGKVVYVKDFGVFFDIGCHSDAFCHVSRLRDDFVGKPQELFKEGDELLTRVVEIDRKRKRITISLQSDERVADEHFSAQAREERKKARKNSRRKNGKRNESEDASSTKNHRTNQDHSMNETPRPGSISSKQSSAPTKLFFSAKVTTIEPVKVPPSNLMTPAEEKRARKLSRRAARRENSDAAPDK